MNIHGGTAGLKACDCGSEALQLHYRSGNKFGFAVLCTACTAVTPWARLSTVARAFWNRGDRIAKGQQ